MRRSFQRTCYKSDCRAGRSTRRQREDKKQEDKAAGGGSNCGGEESGGMKLKGQSERSETQG